MSRTRPGSSPAERLELARGTARRSARPRSSRPSSSIVSIVASPARQAIGLPPKVLACIPGLSDLGDLAAVAIITPGGDPAGQGLGAGQDVGLDAVECW